MKPQRFVLALALGLMGLAADYTSVQAATQSMNRAEIRSMPITSRPSRPGHFYGNAVRRAHGRRSGS